MRQIIVEGIKDYFFENTTIEGDGEVRVEEVEVGNYRFFKLIDKHDLVVGMYSLHNGLMRRIITDYGKLLGYRWCIDHKNGRFDYEY